MGDESWEVYDGWHSWRARVCDWPSPIRRRPGYRFVREQRFGSFAWQQRQVSRWFATREACERAARVWLNGIVHDGGLVT